MLEQIIQWAITNNKEIHPTGYIVLGPPGIGKTTFVESHSTAWVDADEIFTALDLHTEKWHSEQHLPGEEKEHYQACDHALGKMRDAGLWVIGSLFWEFKADAIVLIDTETHKSYVDQRSDLDWPTVQKIRVILEEIALSNSIEIFETISAAVPRTTVKQYVKK